MPQLWNIRDAQLLALVEVSRLAFEERALAHVQRFFPEVGPADSLRAHIPAAAQRALQHGLRSESALLHYLDATLILGLGFEEQPGAEWAVAFLLDPDVGDPEARMRRLHAELIHRLAREEKNQRALQEWDDE